MSGEKFLEINKQAEHKYIQYLWQQPKELSELMDTDLWYKLKKLGPNPLISFMSRILHSADLPRVYTHYSIRAAGTTFLHCNNFSSKQVMSITDHKSLNSLAIYEKVSTNEKLAMGMSINYYLQSDDILLDLQGHL